MVLSQRALPGRPNRIAQRRAGLAADGIDLTDLTDTNPTRHGLFDPVVLEIVAEADAQAGRYDPTPRGPWPARASLAERFGGDPEDYWLTASTSEAYSWLFMLLADPGQTIAIPSPGYPLIEPLAQLQALTTASYRTLYAHPSGWELDRDHLGQVLSAPEVRAVVAVNPNNPTGAYADPSLATAAAERGLPLIADEVFFPFDLARSGQRSRLADDVPGLTFSLDGLSKLLAAPQLKLGWIRLSGPAHQRRLAAQGLDHIADTFLSVNAPVALALPRLLDLADATAARVTTRLRTNLETARQVFGDLRSRTVDGGWMTLLDVPPLLPADDLVIALMERAGLHVHPGYFYDLPGSTLALSLLPDPAVFREGCVRLAAALQVFAADA